MQFNKFENNEWLECHRTMPQDQLSAAIREDLATHMEVVGGRLATVGYPMELWSTENKFAVFICNSFYRSRTFHTPHIPLPLKSFDGFTMPRVHDSVLANFQIRTQFHNPWQWLQCTQGEEWWPHAHSWIVHDAETFLLAMKYDASRERGEYLEPRTLGRPKDPYADERREMRKQEKEAALAQEKAEREQKRAERKLFAETLETVKAQRKREKQEFIERNEAEAKEVKAKALELRLESDKLYEVARKILARRP